MSTQAERTQARLESWIIAQRIMAQIHQLKRINRRRKRAFRAERKQRIYR